MFDIGFSELILIAIVTLLVVGPERMPKVARTAGHLFGRLQRYISEVKTDINRELKLDELRKLEADMREKARDMEHTMTDEINRADQELKQVAEAVQMPPEPEPVPPTPEASAVAAASTQLELGLDAAPAKPEKIT